MEICDFKIFGEISGPNHVYLMEFGEFGELWIFMELANFVNFGEIMAPALCF